MDKDELLRKTVFRGSYLLLMFIPLILFVIAEYYLIPYLNIPSLIFYSFIIFTGVSSYTPKMIEVMSKKEDYKYHISQLAWSPQVRFFCSVVIALTFVYFDYLIFGFLIILASGGEISLQNKVFNQKQ